MTVVSRAELTKVGGLTGEQIALALDTLPSHEHCDSTVLYPCSLVWLMGFGWSSYICQNTLLGICNDAGLVRSQASVAENPLPCTANTIHAVATDDVMIFSTGGPSSTVELTSRLEASMDAAGLTATTRRMLLTT